MWFGYSCYGMGVLGGVMKSEAVTEAEETFQYIKLASIKTREWLDKYQKPETNLALVSVMEETEKRLQYILKTVRG